MLVARPSTAMTSDATAMSNEVSRGTPFSLPPRPTMTLRRARSEMSSTRGQVIENGSMSRALPWLRWLSIIAASRLWAIDTAWVSPVRWRLKSSIGTTCELPPPAAPPLMPKVGPSEGWRMVAIVLLADPVHRLGEADRRQRLALAQRRRRHAGDDDELAVGLVLEAVEDVERDLGLVLAVLLDLVFEQSELGGNFADRLEGCFLCDLEVALHIIRLPQGSMVNVLVDRSAIESAAQCACSRAS